MKGIYIADHTRGQGNLVQLVADSGKMKTSRNGDLLEIQIFNAIQYRQLLESEQQLKTRPMLKMHFKEQQIKIDLTELKMQKTNEDLFKNNYQMLTLYQLQNSIDSFTKRDIEIKKGIYEQISKNFTPFYESSKNLKNTHGKVTSLKYYIDSLPVSEKVRVYEKALESLRNQDSYLNSIMDHELQSTNYNKLRFNAEWHRKLTLPLTCLVLFFVGAPFGAIVRKGGLGMPVVISVVLFIVFHVIKTSLEKAFLEGAVDWFWGMWGSAFVFLPFGIWLSWMAANDSAIFDVSSYSGITKYFKHKLKNA